jgi:hypothetical protein
LILSIKDLFMFQLVPGIKFGPYLIEKVLPEGTGGFGRVVLARRLEGGVPRERVALKLALTYGAKDIEYRGEASLQALSTEVEALRELKHPGIVRIYPILEGGKRPAYMARAMGLEGQPWYFAMEYLAGGSVEALAEKKGKLSLKLAAEIVQQVAEALEYAHAKGYYHGDIKARNILLRRPFAEHLAPEVVLADFGAAKRRGRTGSMDYLSLLHAPPERVRVWRGDIAPEVVKDYGAVDVYSLGVVFYRLVAGRLPFQGRGSHVSTAILEGEVTWPSAYNAELRQLPEMEELILAMLAREPGERPSVKEVIRRLELLVPLPRFSGEAGEGAGVVLKGGRNRLAIWQGATFGFFLVGLLGGWILYPFAHGPMGGVTPTSKNLGQATVVSSFSPTVTLGPSKTIVPVTRTPTCTATPTCTYTPTPRDSTVTPVATPSPVTPTLPPPVTPSIPTPAS